MPSIEKKISKKTGKITSFVITVSQGYDTHGNKIRYHKTFKVPKDMTERQAEKEAQRQAVLFEEKCRQGLAGDSNQRFCDYADYVLNIKLKNGELRHHTLVRYKELLIRINNEIGHLKLSEIRPQTLNELYIKLGSEGMRKSSKKALLKQGVDLKKIIHKKGYTSIERFLKDQAKIAMSSYRNACNGIKINPETADKLSAALGVAASEIFDYETDNKPLSSKTVKEHHRLIHMILKQAESELLIPYNPAARAKSPKVQKTHANFFNTDQLCDILNVVDDLPIKWKTLVNLLIVLGGRRGEVLGINWANVDFDLKRIYINKCVYYEPDIGLYIDNPKNEKSVRYINLTDKMIDLLKQYKKEYYDPLKQSCIDTWNSTKSLQGDIIDDFLFVKDSGKKVGAPMHPDSVTQYCDNLSKKHNLPHINPHAFRHTAASFLIFNGVDTVSVSGYLGHASPTTTETIYAHILADARSRNAEVIGAVLDSIDEKRSAKK